MRTLARWLLFVLALTVPRPSPAAGDAAPRGASEDLPASYETWSASAKLDHLWNERILPSEYPQLPALGFAMFHPKVAFLRVTFDRVSDEMPAGRPRMIHAHGVVCQVELRPDPASPFTGLFRSGACGLARLSVAGPPGMLLNFTPGMALKLFVDGHPSANVLAMHSVDGQGADHSFFRKTFSNIVDPPRTVLLQILGRSFGRAVNDPTHLSVHQLAGNERSGARPAAVRAPVQLLFEPVPALSGRPDAGSHEDFRVKLARIPAGSTLYEVLAREHENDPPVHIGTLVTRSRFVASRWGDERIFFNHQE